MGIVLKDEASTHRIERLFDWLGYRPKEATDNEIKTRVEAMKNRVEEMSEGIEDADKDAGKYLLKLGPFSLKAGRNDKARKRILGKLTKEEQNLARKFNPSFRVRRRRSADYELEDLLEPSFSADELEDLLEQSFRQSRITPPPTEEPDYDMPLKRVRRRANKPQQKREITQFMNDISDILKVEEPKAQLVRKNAANLLKMIETEVGKAEAEIKFRTCQLDRVAAEQKELRKKLFNGRRGSFAGLDDCESFKRDLDNELRGQKDELDRFSRF